MGRLKNGDEQSLSDYLEQNYMDIEELNMALLKKSSQKIGSTRTENRAHLSSYQLIFWRKATGASDNLVCDGCLNGGCDANHAPFSIEISQEKRTTKQTAAANIHALFKLNVGNVITHIEEADNINDTDKQTILAM